MGRLFGTDGIRGIANSYPTTPEMAVRVGKATAHYFREQNQRGRHKIVIGKDTRLSGYMLESALTSGIVSCGVDVLLVGPMPTPAIAHLTRSLNADAGIVLSASHNPAEDNGIKIFDSSGCKLDDSVEEKIEQLVFSEEINNEHIRGDKIGKAFRIGDAKGRYIEFAKNSIGNTPLNGLRLVLDCANGAAYSVAPTIFSELGADVVVLNNRPDGLNINLGCGALHPEVIQAAVKEHGADIGIALDGDADRVIVCDENGNSINGDHLLAILARHLKERGQLKKNTVAATVMSNLGLDRAMEREGIMVVRTKVGDRYLLEEMKRRGLSLGGEQSGHIILGDYSTTGDGIITALQLLRIMKDSGKKLSELADVLQPFPQVLVNVSVAEKKPFGEMPSVERKIAEARERLGSMGRVFVRYSGTENIARVMVEGKRQGEIRELADAIARQLRVEIGG
jgi:phosphoglucosamine mutase